MKSSPPDEAAPSGDLQVVVSGTSIELRALLGRLVASGAKAIELPLPEGTMLAAQLVLCDLASDGALAQVASFYSGQILETEPRFIAIGTPTTNLTEAESALLGRARHRFRRPLDIQSVVQTLLLLLREPRPSRAPQS